jgi:hypothetical protein
VVRLPPTPEVAPPDVVDPLVLDPPELDREVEPSLEHAAQTTNPSNGNNAVTEDRLFIELLIG